MGPVPDSGPACLVRGTFHFPASFTYHVFPAGIGDTTQKGMAVGQGTRKNRQKEPTRSSPYAHKRCIGEGPVSGNDAWPGASAG